MARKGGSTKLKRLAAPSFWRIPRKTHKFVIKPRPGPHSLQASYPLLVLIRDVLGLAYTSREARVAIKEGSILVDGVIRRDVRFPVGLMDVISIPSIGKHYRILPKGGRLMPKEIPIEEANKKLCRINVKVSVKGGRLQLGLHDGRCLLIEDGAQLKPGDACLLEVPSQRLLESVKAEVGSLALVIGGSRAGLIGEIKGIEAGSFSREAMVRMELGGEEAELPKRLIMPVGTQRPLLTLE